MNNWLVNPTGSSRGFIPVDLLQEHMNLYIKVSPLSTRHQELTFLSGQSVYKAHGSNASWEWLEIIAPCITQLRQLSTMMHDTFGSFQGNKHAPPDLSNDIDELMNSLREHAVYMPQESRSIDGDKAEVPDVVALGAGQLVTPIIEYNAMFERLRQRRRLRPLVGSPVFPASSPSESAPGSPSPYSWSLSPDGHSSEALDESKYHIFWTV